MPTETILISTLRPPAATAAEHPSLVLHNLHTASLLASHKRIPTSLHCVAASSTHLFTVPPEKSQLSIHALPSGQPVTTIPLPEAPTCLSLSPAHDHLALGLPNGSILLLSLTSNRLIVTQRHHLSSVSTLSWSSTGTLLASGGEDAAVHVFSVATLLSVSSELADRKPLTTPGRAHKQQVVAVEFLPASAGGASETLITVGRDGAVNVIEAYTGKILRTSIVAATPSAMAVDPAGRAVYVGDVDGGVWCVDLYTQPGKLVTVDTASRWSSSGGKKVLEMGVSFEGNLIVTGDEGGRVCVWEAGSGRVVRILLEGKAAVSGVLLKVEGRGEGDERKGWAIETMPKVRWENVLDAGKIEGVACESVSVKLVGRIRNRKDRRKTDEEVVARGARDMERWKGKAEGAGRIRELEEEVRRLYEVAERMAENQKAMWGALVEREEARMEVP